VISCQHFLADYQHPLTSDCLGSDGFHVVVRELPDEGETESGGRPFYGFACRPGLEKATPVSFLKRTLGTYCCTLSAVSQSFSPNAP
jgi:hypothetical protein